MVSRRTPCLIKKKNVKATSRLIENVRGYDADSEDNTPSKILEPSTKRKRLVTSYENKDVVENLETENDADMESCAE